MASFSTSYQDSLEPLNKSVPLPDKIRAIHRVLADRLGDIDRIAAALYDPKTDLLKTFVDSSASDDRPLHHYQAPLSESFSLQEIIRTGRPRVVNDLNKLGERPCGHVRRLPVPV